MFLLCSGSSPHKCGAKLGPRSRQNHGEADGRANPRVEGARSLLGRRRAHPGVHQARSGLLVRASPAQWPPPRHRPRVGGRDHFGQSARQGARGAQVAGEGDRPHHRAAEGEAEDPDLPRGGQAGARGAQGRMEEREASGSVDYHADHLCLPAHRQSARLRYRRAGDPGRAGADLAQQARDGAARAAAHRGRARLVLCQRLPDHRGSAPLHFTRLAPPAQAGPAPGGAAVRGRARVPGPSAREGHDCAARAGVPDPGRGPIG